MQRTWGIMLVGYKLRRRRGWIYHVSVLLTLKLMAVRWSAAGNDVVQAWHMIPQPTASSGISTRRRLLETVAAVTVTTTLPQRVFASVDFDITRPKLQGITTVIVESSTGPSLGVQLNDAKVASTSFPLVKSVEPQGIAAQQGIQEGMIVLGHPSSASLVQRLRSGPFPYAVQFYNLAVELDEPEAGAAATKTTPRDALLKLQKQTQTEQQQLASQEAKLSSRGTGLVVKTTTKPPNKCDAGARRGDRLTIRYEARVASPGGPIYDVRSDPVSFVMGDGNVVSGVDIGLGGMCPGETRELDIPSTLGYGRAGSEKFDIPGDVRLWWKVELVDLEKNASPRKSPLGVF